jgi:hypothetical protein
VSGTNPDQEQARWARLELALDELLLLDEPARQRRLAELGEQAVEDAAALRGWLRGIERADEIPLRSAAQDGQPAASQRVGPWSLLRPIGQGGMGTVWLAERADGAYRQQVAIKFLREDSPSLRSRFAQERQALARLRHAHIARLLDAGFGADGTPYLVTEYVDGLRLDRWCEREHADLDQRLRLFRAVAAAVAHAHQHLIVHRDLKPPNILVDKAAQVHLLDFGIAKLLDADGAQTHERALTPDFAAPEQLTGQPVTTATDVYALGALLYQLLSGSPPLAMRDLPLAEFVRRVCDVVPPPPSQVAKLAQVPARRLRGDLDAIVGKALAKSPSDRYATVDALLRDLDRSAARLPIDARAPSRRYRLRRFLQRHRVAVAVAGLLGLALALGVFGTLWQARIAAQERDMARAERDVARLEAARNGALYEFLIGLFRDSADESEKFTASELLSRGATWLKAHPPADRDSAVLVHSVLGELQLLRRDPQGARDLLTPLLERKDLDALPAELGARLRCVLAFAEHAGGKLERARELSEEGVALAMTLKGSARATLLRCRSVAGAVLADLNRDAAAMDMLRAALTEAEGLGDDAESLRQLAGIEHAYALGSYYGGQIGDSIIHNERALAIYTRLGRRDSAEALSTLGNLAMARLNGGRVLDADASFAEVIARTEEHAGASAGLSQRLINAASAKLVLEQPDAALPLLGRAATIQRELKISEGAPLAQTALERGKAALLRGDLSAVEAELALAEQRIAASYPPSHYYHGLVPEQRGRLWQARGDPARAQAQFDIAATHFRAGGRAALRPLVRTLALKAEYALASDDAAALRGAADKAANAAQALPSADWLRAWAEVLQGRSRQLVGDGTGTAQIRSAEPRLVAALGAEHRLTRSARQWAAER